MNNPFSLTSAELAASLVFPRISAENFFADSAYRDNIKSLVGMGIGGFCVFRGEVDNTFNMIEKLQSESGSRLLFCADFEHGLPMRLENGTSFPRAMACGKLSGTEKTYQMAKTIAMESRAIGIKWNLAPVCDVNSNPENPIINVRSYGETVEKVSAHSLAYINGTQSEFVLACAKHFPGHGDTSVDSHLELPVLLHDIDRIESLELKPVITAIEAGVRSIMPGHLAVPALDDAMLPASLSYKILTELLRNRLNFKGIIISDALEMKAITKKYTSGEAAIRAIEAGVNIILLPEVPLAAISAMAEQANDDDEFGQKLVESNRLLIESRDWTEKRYKPAYDLNTIKTNSAIHEKLSLEIANAAVELTGDETLLPLDEDKIITALAFVQDDNLNIPTKFFEMLAQATENDCDFGFIDDNITDDEINSFKNSFADSDIIIFAFFYRAMAYKGSIKPGEKFGKIIGSLSEGKKVITILFGNPYMKDEIPSDLHILTFSDTLPSVAATVMKLSGRKM